MNKLQEELFQLFKEQHELESKLEIIKERQINLHQEILSNLRPALPVHKQENEVQDNNPKTKSKITKRTVNLVADKLGRKFSLEKNGQPTLLSIVLEAMTVLEEPLDTKIIKEYILERRPDTRETSIHNTLRRGFDKGVFKRIKDGLSYKWYLNEASKPKRTHKTHSRPNYGIGEAVADYINRQEPETIIFPSSILDDVQDDFRKATEDTVEAALRKLVAEGKGEKRELGDQRGYVFKNKVKA